MEEDDWFARRLASRAQQEPPSSNGLGGLGGLGWDQTLTGRGALGGLGFDEPDGDPWGASLPRRRDWAEPPVPPPARHPGPLAQAPVADPWAQPSAGPEEWVRRPAGPAPWAHPQPEPQAAPPPWERPAPEPPLAPAPSVQQPAESPAPRSRRAGRSIGSAVRHPVRVLLYTVVVLGLLGGALGWVSLDKVVTLRIDGQPRAVHTYASTVQGVLDDEKIDVKSHDVLAPGPDAKVEDGSEIVLRRGRLLRLTVDGQSRPVWVQATTVQEALEQIGFRQKGLALSASRSDRLPLDGFDLAIRTPKTVTVLADGRRLQLTTTVVTVGEALEKLGVKIDSDDRVSQLAAAPLVNGMTITVTRVMRKTLTTKAVLKYRVIEKSDPTLNKGTRKVTTQGVDGLQEVTYVATYINGKVASKKVVSTRVLRKTVDQVVLVGTKAVQPAECADFPTTGGLDWCGLAKCESGLNPTAVNPAGPYYGLYQFDLGTWQSNGGSGLPTEASVAEQTRVAYNLYRARGRSPWPVCGQYL